MTQENPGQPKLDDLLARYLNRQAGAHASGLAAFNAGEVMPYDAGPVQPIDPKPAWDEALTALDQATDVTKLTAPPHWPQLVAGHEPVVALAWCAGNFPQLVRNFHDILHQANLSELRPKGGRAVPAPELIDWAHQVTAAKKFPEAVLALGAMRLAKQFDEADVLVKALESQMPPAWHAAWTNELAALAWHRGQAEEARRIWQASNATLPVRFNRGMAELFSGDSAAARSLLQDVAQQIPESSAWHHLARLYRALAEQR
jgi:tetratricopeptide (TPR) repeat protein